MASKGSCSVCGKTVAVTARSLPEPICRSCRPTMTKLERGRAHTAHVRETHKDCGGGCTNSQHVPCAGTCGKAIWIGTASSPNPMCRDCRSAQPSKNAKVCIRCGKEFVAKGGAKFYCSRDCAYPTRSQYSSQRERNTMKCQRRRVRSKGAYVEDVVPSVVFERDGWICQLCHETVDKTLHGWDRMAASIDHIIPLVQGGLHCYSNIQLAHRSCNSSKGARWQGQLTLT